MVDPIHEPDTDPQILSPLQATILYVIVAFMLISGGGLLQSFGLWGVTASLWLLIACPTVAAVAAGQAGRGILAGLGIRRVALRHVLASVLLGLSCWFVNAWAVLWVQEYFLPVPQEFLDKLEKAITPGGVSLALTLMAVVVTPAICEELLCRGVLTRSFRKQLGLGGAVLLSSLMFALLHFSIYRFAPTFALGLVLGFATLKTRSVVPAMIIHALNNLPMALATTGPGGASLDWLYHSGWGIRLLSLVAVAVGLWLLTTRIRR